MRSPNEKLLMAVLIEGHGSRTGYSGSACMVLVCGRKQREATGRTGERAGEGGWHEEAGEARGWRNAGGVAGVAMSPRWKAPLTLEANVLGRSLSKRSETPRTKHGLCSLFFEAAQLCGHCTRGERWIRRAIARSASLSDTCRACPDARRSERKLPAQRSLSRKSALGEGRNKHVRELRSSRRGGAARALGIH